MEVIGMASEKVQVPVVEEAVGEQREPQVVAELHIRVLDNGGMQLHVPEESEELQAAQIEGITRTVSEQLRDARIAQQAVEMFKARLG
jgi:hypothetical protein